jgi:hypothetical protein
MNHIKNGLDNSESKNQEGVVKDLWVVISNDLKEMLWEDHKLDKEIANKLINRWYREEVIRNIDKFTWLDKEIAMRIISKIKDRSIYLTNSWMTAKTWENHTCSAFDAITLNADKFEWFELNKEVALSLIDAWLSRLVVENFEVFSWCELDREVAIKLIHSWDEWIWCLFNKLYKFNGLVLDYEMANEFVWVWKSYNIIAYFNKFNLSEEELKKLWRKDRYLGHQFSKLELI